MTRTLLHACLWGENAARVRWSYDNVLAVIAANLRAQEDSIVAQCLPALLRIAFALLARLHADESILTQVLTSPRN
jgi:hypothetical protein